MLSRILQQYHPHLILRFYEQFIIIDGKESDCIPPQDWMKEYDKHKYEDLIIKDVDGLIPKEILGLSYGDYYNFKFVFCMKWSNRDTPDFVTSYHVYRYWPQIAINFFKSYVVWKGDIFTMKIVTSLKPHQF